MMNFTPGPWQVSGVRYKWRQSDSSQILDSHAVGPDGDAVCLVFYTERHHKEQLANARLIAAAPKMLEILKRLCELNRKGQVMARSWGDAQDIIKLTEGLVA